CGAVHRDAGQCAERPASLDAGAGRGVPRMMGNAECGIRNWKLKIEIASKEIEMTPAATSTDVLDSPFRIPNSEWEQTEMESSVMVQCKAVTKEFGSGDTRIEVLHGIDLEIPPGELVLLVGPSGCGKTTLISIIAGLLDATKGTVSVLGEELGALKGA